jgi:hypothetical protein
MVISQNRTYGAFAGATGTSQQLPRGWHKVGATCKSSKLLQDG